jgi:hypothetical protein
MSRKRHVPEALRALRQIDQDRALKTPERRMLQALVMLSEPGGDRAEDDEILKIVGNAIALVEKLGHDPHEFVLKARARVFSRKRRRKRKADQGRRARRPDAKHPPGEFRTIELDPEDAALVLREDGVQEVYDSSTTSDDEEVNDSTWVVNVLAHYVSDRHLLRELEKRFDRYLRENIEVEH